MPNGTKRRSKGTGSIKELGDGKYRLRVVVGHYPDGTARQKQVTIKAASKSAALLHLEQLNTQYEEQRQKSDVYTLEEYFERVVLPSKTSTTKANRDGYTTAWAHIPDEWKKAELHEPTQTEVQQWIDTMTRGTAKASVKHLRSILRQAYGDELLDRAPMEVKYRYPDKITDDRTVWNAEQMATVLLSVRGLEIEPYIVIGIGTGARREELIALNWEDIVVERVGRSVIAWVSITKAITDKDFDKTTKTESSKRTVPVTGYIAERIAELHQGTGCIQTGRDDEHLRPSGLRRRWNNLWREGGKVRRNVIRPDGVLLTAGVPRICPNHLRHTHITYMRECGVDRVTCNRYHGHVPESVEEIHYNTYHNAQMLQAARITSANLDKWVAYVEAGMEQ